MYQGIAAIVGIEIGIGIEIEVVIGIGIGIGAIETDLSPPTVGSTETTCTACSL